MEGGEYRQIADRAEAFFRKLRWVMIGLAAGAVAVFVAMLVVFRAVGW